MNSLHSPDFSPDGSLPGDSSLIESAPKAFRFGVPFIRWADTVRVEKGEFGARDRQLYDHEFVYVLEGCGTIILDGQKHLAQPDSLFLVSPRVWHSFHASEEPQRLLGVHFDWGWKSDCVEFSTHREARAPFETELFRDAQSVKGWDLATMPFLDLRGRPRVRKMLEDVVAEYGRGDEFSREMAGAFLAACIGQIAREVWLLRELSLNVQIGADAVRRVQKARELLESTEGARLSIEEIAARVDWSGDHLRRMFKAVLNATPLQIQTAARVRRAQEFLRYGGLPIAQIARRCGFEDASHFTRVFKKEVGVTPREWASLSKTQLPK